MRLDGTKDDRMLSPDAVAVDADDNLYVTDTDAEGLIYVLQEVGMVQVINPKGELLFCFGHYGVEAGEFKNSLGIFIDPTNRFYVADTGNLRVQVFQIRNEQTVLHAAGR
jgi:DNA-binding beta-propeller fold protein YncE